MPAPALGRPRPGDEGGMVQEESMLQVWERREGFEDFRGKRVWSSVRKPIRIINLTTCK